MGKQQPLFAFGAINFLQLNQNVNKVINKNNNSNEKQDKNRNKSQNKNQTSESYNSNNENNEMTEMLSNNTNNLDNNKDSKYKQKEFLTNYIKNDNSIYPEIKCIKSEKTKLQDIYNYLNSKLKNPNKKMAYLY